MDAARAELNRVYERFMWQFGVIHDPRNQRLFGDLPELQFLLALERNPRRTTSGRWVADRERIFRERTLRSHQAILPGTLTPTEALRRCLDERGRLDLAYIATLVSQPQDRVLEALSERVYRLPGTQQYELADVYLSGHVVAKLRDAQAWAERDPAFARNVAALEAVQPAPLGPKEIIINLNAFWLPGATVTAFITLLLPTWSGTAFYSPSLSEWKLTDPGRQGADAVEASTRWGTGRADAVDLLQASLRGVPITVYDVITVDDREKRVLNPAETVAAQEKQQAIADAFQRWVWDDPARADELCQIYNQRFNSVRMRVYDGNHLSFPGINTTLLRDGDLADYQKGAVWQILQQPSTLLGFAVGGGKTFTKNRLKAPSACGGDESRVRRRRTSNASSAPQWFQVTTGAYAALGRGTAVLSPTQALTLARCGGRCESPTACGGVVYYLTESSFDAFMFAGIERKARFIEQALADEITARTAEDTSDVVLSAAEIKAIASGNPQIVRKVQREAEIARLERVRAVWLDTRRNLQLERRCTEDEIRRVERRGAHWAQAQALVAAAGHDTFRAQIASGVGQERYDIVMNRAEAGAAVRRLVHDYQSTAAFQRQRLRGVVACYRGLDLVVVAHPVFAAELSLALPDGAPLDTIAATTDAGVWQSVGHLVNEIPAIVRRLESRIAEAHARMVTINRELLRLEQWDGQATYDAAAAELSAINAAFAAAEAART